jgi:hypothetical protein
METVLPPLAPERFDGDLVEWALSIDLEPDAPQMLAASEEDIPTPREALRDHLDSVARWLFRIATWLDAGVVHMNREVDDFNQQVGRYQTLVVNLIFLYGALEMIRTLI